MMVTKIFWEDPYLTELTTYITSVNGNQITVNETIFYAFSGGQESDTGTLGGFPVVEAKKAGKEIIYTLPENHHLIPGDPVSITIDWARRYRLMRLHFAAEIVLELVYKQLKNIEKIGAHISEDKSRIDFYWQENISSHFPSLEKAANEIIAANWEIDSAFSDEENERRFWEIKEFSRVPCGGTHIKKTGEIGSISLKRKNIGKGKERIEIFVEN